MTHLHEVVENLVHWFDDKIFRLYPTWEDCERGGIFPTALLEKYFGPLDKNRTGPAKYIQCAERGIGRKIIAKMLEGTANVDEIRKAIDNFPMSEQRRRTSMRWSITWSTGSTTKFSGSTRHGMTA